MRFSKCIKILYFVVGFLIILFSANAIDTCLCLGSVKPWKDVGNAPGTVWTKDLTFVETLP